MNRRTIQLVLVASLVAIAGCAGGMGGNPGTDAPTDDSSMTDSSGGTGTAAFYVSDEPSVIDDFEHLNVTITKVGFKKTDNVTADATNETDGNVTDGNVTEAESDSAGNESTTETPTNETAENDSEDSAADEQWIEREVNETTVDLTELKGANASMIDEFELPAGEYETVFIYVSDTEGVLTDGTETQVKLPSNKLQLHTTFTIGNNESVDFVYDIAPHKAGKSGKYVLKPVISESGTGDEVEIHDIDEQKPDESTDGEQQDDTTGDETEATQAKSGGQQPTDTPQQG
ncbi:DUF4382 domain-containing protein [Haloterrigena sp. H1]|uniref:DUF4382 domain-containing protein n=1 Tax=Haloterrigena sp. H1 TaxID=2552943 RepID=UPI00110EB6EA|nr:DUF4382 domain-containing protein [Haloterrigena sp. H1]TMT77915.1 DUF4382 domain-containing protein [Haloterrigena sp. H1]TMT78485.1 DUF4382 domain-containing protein [Haloterrigena sp. H1]TMT80408.1 DUF4382 domain-containing protein [Haloterrigena sp. H1]